MKQKINVYISYHSDDQQYVSEVEKKLFHVPMRRKYSLEIWHREKINPGEDKKKEIIDNVKKSHIYIPIITVNAISFEADKYLLLERNEALEKHNNGSIRVIPLYYRASHYNFFLEDFGSHIKILSNNGNPLSKNGNSTDDIWVKAQTDLIRIFESFHSNPKRNEEISTIPKNVSISRNSKKGRLKRNLAITIAFFSVSIVLLFFVYYMTSVKVNNKKLPVFHDLKITLKGESDNNIESIKDSFVAMKFSDTTFFKKLDANANAIFQLPIQYSEKDSFQIKLVNEKYELKHYDKFYLVKNDSFVVSVKEKVKKTIKPKNRNLSEKTANHNKTNTSKNKIDISQDKINLSKVKVNGDQNKVNTHGNKVKMSSKNCDSIPSFINGFVQGNQSEIDNNMLPVFVKDCSCEEVNGQMKIEIELEPNAQFKDLNPILLKFYTIEIDSQGEKLINIPRYKCLEFNQHGRVQTVAYRIPPEIISMEEEGKSVNIAIGFYEKIDKQKYEYLCKRN